MTTNHTSVPSTDGVFDVEGACKFLRIGRQTFYDEVNSGRLQTFRIKSRRLVSRSALLAYIAAREAEENAA